MEHWLPVVGFEGRYEDWKTHMTVRVVKVSRSVFPDRPWRIENETGEVNEDIWPDDWLKEAVGFRPHCYFRAEKSVDGWQFKSRYKGRPLYW